MLLPWILLASAAAPAASKVCDPTLAPAAFCDVTLSPVDRAEALVAKLSLQEKVDNVGANGAAGVPRFGIPAFQWWGEALHGVCQSPSVQFRPPTPNGTSFPEIIGVGATFDEDLFRRMGAAIGREARVMMNAGNAGGTFWAPNINIVKDPRWGRLQETPGECPILTATYAARFVSAFQNRSAPSMKQTSDAGSGSYVQASSCCKHWAGYSEENWGGLDRYHFDASINAQDWEETYLPAFQGCMVHGKASGLMCSYNAVNGTPTCASPHLLTTVARGELGFDGYITGDCGAAEDVFTAHNFTRTAKESADATLAAGMDVDCGSFLKSHLLDPNHDQAAVVTVNATAIDRALVRLFSTRIRLGLFDEPSYDPLGYKALTPASIDRTAHEGLARRASDEGIVLLKLEPPPPQHQHQHQHQKTLSFPLDTARLRKGGGGEVIALVGPNADNPGNMQGVDCHGVPPFLITPRVALEARFGADMINYEQGCAINSCDPASFSKAVSAANSSGTAIVVVGLDPSQEYEMRDRTSLLLPQAQEKLVAAVCAAAAASSRDTRRANCIVVIMSGGAIDISAMMANANVTTILWAGYPGQSGGDSIVDILLGKVNPSGRVPLTWYKEAYLYNGHPSDGKGPQSPNALSMYDMRLRPTDSSSSSSGSSSSSSSSSVPLGRTYRFFEGNDTTQLFPFGFGLQYHSFAYSPITIGASSVPAAAIDATVGAADFRRHSRLDAATLTTATLSVSCAPSATVPSHPPGPCPHTVLVFVAPPGAGTGGLPIKTLAGFKRLFDLTIRGPAAAVSFNLTAYDLSIVDGTGVRRALPGDWTVIAGVAGGGSGDLQTAKVTITA